MRVALLALPILAIAAAPLGAQSARVRSTTTARYAQLRPIRYDPVSGSYVAEPVASATPITQDVEISAWGFAVQGLRAFGVVRGRTALGSDLVWPRFDDHFDALYLFLELERPHYRVRAGRQQRASGLGFYAFDGLTATVRPWATVRVEAYGGRGLARGFLEPQNSEAVRSLDPLRPDKGTILLGTSFWAAPSAGSSFSAIYQRELLSDRSGLVSERAAFDGRVSVGRLLVLSGSADADLALGAWGRARLGALVRIGRRSFVEVEAFRYKPLLDLTTIWGAFAPEAHRGAGASLHVSPKRSLALTSSFTYRRYEPLSSGAPFQVDIPDDAKQFAVGARWQAGSLLLDGSYRLQLDFGGAQSGGDVSAAFTRPDGWRLGARGVAFQQDAAFRVTNGTVYGAGLEARGPIGDRVYVRGEFMRYLHRKLSGQAALDWNQTRALLSLEWTFGANPDRSGALR